MNQNLVKKVVWMNPNLIQMFDYHTEIFMKEIH